MRTTRTLQNHPCLRKLAKHKFNVKTPYIRHFSANGGMHEKALEMDHQQDAVRTQVLPVNVRNIGEVTAIPRGNEILDEIHFQFKDDSRDVTYLRFAAQKLRDSHIPVAFPTETVYGLGADATRSSAVKGIYKAKQRPSDNPLIVHFASLRQLRKLLAPAATELNGHQSSGVSADPIPDIYKPLISKFWPGPLTIILPNPRNSPLATEVSAGLQTFGARIPSDILALALIQLADVPIAAPSANASAKPSPTAAEHVAHDLKGRIELILDGGPCVVGVESTVVDGLQNPPLVLRPGGISIEQLRTCAGWEQVHIGYMNSAENAGLPKAPGMKYRHYAPKAPVILYEQGQAVPSTVELCAYLKNTRTLGIVTTKRWKVNVNDESRMIHSRDRSANGTSYNSSDDHAVGFERLLRDEQRTPSTRASLRKHELHNDGSKLELLEIALGDVTADIARGIFSALREFDIENVEAILVEGIDDSEGDTAAAIMNRLRKAAEVNVGG